MHVQALLILKGQVPSKKRGKGDLQGMESLDDDSNKNQGWPISGPYDMNRWREAVERCEDHEVEGLVHRACKSCAYSFEAV